MARGKPDQGSLVVEALAHLADRLENKREGFVDIDRRQLVHIGDLANGSRESGAVAFLEGKSETKGFERQEDVGE